ncbi:MAG: histidine kinase dimerization/phospho-acceptor domain-containing protein, partial [Anaerovoracaceae bacterium]
IRNIPIEVILAIGLVLFLFIGAVNSGFYETGTDAFAVMIAVDTVFLTIIGAGFILVFAAKLRQNNLWKSSVTYLIYRFIRWIGLRLLYVLNSIHLVWKSALVVAAGIFINLFIVLNCAYNGSMLLIWFAGAVLVEAFAVYSAMALKKLKDGGKHLADGDLEYQIDKKGLFLDLSEHADNLNSIGQGMAKAVDEKMKSEMFKTELITNVSHDIKTPLTSIINYVDFLKKEKFDNKKAEEYIEVLDRQSQRLKKLTEDLVELSKAATGNVKINMEPCKIGIMMTQVMGEYQEKAEKEDLKLVMNMPENEMEILADGRSLWRVLDNLLNNICKYSQPGTRVYQTLEKQGSRAVITYKNTSKYELNMTADELMERFVRGDSSRHTEGSGLGLSIARNLVELQKGTFDIFIDGDLFKVVMEFEIKDNK